MTAQECDAAAASWRSQEPSAANLEQRLTARDLEDDLGKGIHFFTHSWWNSNCTLALKNK